MMTQPTVCVIGAGIIGLSSAVCIQDKIPGIKVKIIAKDFSPNTTSDGSSGFWMPYLVNPKQSAKTAEWGNLTFRHLHGLVKSEIAGKLGVQLASGYKFSKENVPLNGLGYHVLSTEERHIHPDNKPGVFFTTLMVDVTPYLKWLTDRFQQRGGILEKKQVDCLNECNLRNGKKRPLSDRLVSIFDKSRICDALKALGETEMREKISERKEYEVIINCTGLGAHTLVADKELRPIRGQVLRVRAPWIKHFFLDEDPGNPIKYPYISVIPRVNDVVLGGTRQTDSWDSSVDTNDSNIIYERCCKLLPSLKGAKVISSWAGLRPHRTLIRLEHELLLHSSKQTLVVHNYGHGGSGVTLHWGCALETAEIVTQHYQPPSKL